MALSIRQSAEFTPQAVTGGIGANCNVLFGAGTLSGNVLVAIITIGTTSFLAPSLVNFPTLQTGWITLGALWEAGPDGATWVGTMIACHVSTGEAANTEIINSVNATAWYEISAYEVTGFVSFSPDNIRITVTSQSGSSTTTPSITSSSLRSNNLMIVEYIASATSASFTTPPSGVTNDFSNVGGGTQHLSNWTGHLTSIASATTETPAMVFGAATYSQMAIALMIADTIPTLHVVQTGFGIGGADGIGTSAFPVVFPNAPTAGNLLVFLVIADEVQLETLPTGYLSLKLTDGSGSPSAIAQFSNTPDNSGVAIVGVYHIAGASESATQNISLNNANDAGYGFGFEIAGFTAAPGHLAGNSTGGSNTSNTASISATADGNVGDILLYVAGFGPNSSGTGVSTFPTPPLTIDKILGGSIWGHLSDLAANQNLTPSAAFTIGGGDSGGVVAVGVMIGPVALPVQYQPWYQRAPLLAQ